MIEEMVEILDKLHKLIQNYKQEHREARMGLEFSPQGILNAYREGDLSFDEATKYIIELIKEGNYARF